MAAKFPFTNNFLHTYGSQVVAEQKTRLNSYGKGGGPLEDSLEYKIFNNGTNFGVNFYGNEYTSFVDEGVEGAITHKTWNGFKSRFSYRDKIPPPEVLEDWIRKKGFKTRSKKTGRFITVKSASFALAHSIFRRGSWRTSFFTTPINRSEDRFVKGLEAAMAKDIENNINNAIK